MDSFFIPVLLAAAVGGMSAGLAGVYVVGMRIPFVPVCLSHAALLGAVGALLLGFSETAGALATATISAALLGLMPTRRLRLDENVALAVVFSLSMGLVFLGIGLHQGAQRPVLSLLWGNLLFCGWRGAIQITLAGVALATFVLLFGRQMKAVLFSRVLAATAGVPDTLIYAVFLGLMGLVVTVNLEAVGGLMIFSLIVNPAAAAYQLCRGHRATIITAMLVGAGSALGGFGLSWWSRSWTLPTGACIVVVSALCFAAAALLRLVLRRHD